MNFFEHQDIARRQSKRLVFLFALAVLAIVVSVDLLLLLVFGGIGAGRSGPILFATFATLAVIGCAKKLGANAPVVSRAKFNAQKIA